VGHPGQTKTYQLVCWEFNWPNVMETLDSSELLMEDQAWLDYLWDFETRGINLDLSSDTD